MEIGEVKTDKKRYIDLLLLADEQENMPGSIPFYRWGRETVRLRFHFMKNADSVVLTALKTFSRAIMTIRFMRAAFNWLIWSTCKGVYRISF